MDVLGQLTREEGPAYSARQMAILAEFGPGNGTKETVRT